MQNTDEVSLMKYRYVLNIILLCFMCTIFLPLGEYREFIFVVNTSQSMNDSDPLHVVQDSITWSMANFSAEELRLLPLMISRLLSDRCQKLATYR